MKLFQANITFYNNYSEKSETDTCLIFGNDMAEACKYIDKIGYEYIEELHLITITSDAVNNVIFLPEDEDLIGAIKNANDY